VFCRILNLSVCPGTGISAMVPPIGVNFYTMVQLRPGRVFILFGSDIVRDL